MTYNSVVWLHRFDEAGSSEIAVSVTPGRQTNHLQTSKKCLLGSKAPRLLKYLRGMASEVLLAVPAQVSLQDLRCHRRHNLYG
jgi:hypothetical protein